ncbi:hypothetical protein [Curtobacterium pusillum]|uniref:hypothetical protein n=1 Tax=Curtobacterium pusillum TaxID=69373 RepID=UPI0011A3FEA1|nr:hypothetical protein [Curtobacterium pusillum]
MLTERSRADKRIARDAVDRHLTIRTTARVGDVSVIVDEPWNVEQSATLEVRAADGRARAVRAEDGATLRFVRRGDRATARVRPTDLVGLESDVVGSDGTRTHPSAGPGRR